MAVNSVTFDTRTDVLVCTLAVGNMPPQRVKEYCESVKKNLQETFGTTAKIVMLPAPGDSGTRSTDFSIIHIVT